VDTEGNPTEQMPLTGGWNIAASEGFGFAGDMISENLTPGGKLAGFNDEDLFRALRHGISQDGKLLGFMSLLSYGQLSDGDTEAIIAYLRAQPPAPQAATTGDKLNFVGAVMFGAGLFGSPKPAADTVSAPPQGVDAVYGKYVATFGECRGCHGPDATGVPASPVGPAIPNPRPIIGTWSLEQFIQTMRTGVRPSGTPFSEAMSWQNVPKI